MLQTRRELCFFDQAGSSLARYSDRASVVLQSASIPLAENLLFEFNLNQLVSVGKKIPVLCIRSRALVEASVEASRDMAFRQTQES
jgi:hypothetical protein